MVLIGDLNITGADNVGERLNDHNTQYIMNRAVLNSVFHYREKKYSCSKKQPIL